MGTEKAARSLVALYRCVRGTALCCYASLLCLDRTCLAASLQFELRLVDGGLSHLSVFLENFAAGSFESTNL